VAAFGQAGRAQDLLHVLGLLGAAGEKSKAAFDNRQEGRERADAALLAADRSAVPGARQRYSHLCARAAA